MRGQVAGGTVVVVPSLSFPVEELRKVSAVLSYEERMLFVLLLLDDPTTRVVYTTSVPVDPDVVDYYLRFVSDPEAARERLHLVDAGDPEIGWLAAKLLSQPPKLAELRELVEGADDPHVLPYMATSVEHQLAETLGVPLFGPPLGLADLGSKSGSRKTAVQAGVRVMPGAEDLYSVEELAAAVAVLQSRRPRAEAVVIKLNGSFSGQGNAIIELDDVVEPLPASKTVFCAEDESWPPYIVKVSEQGSIVEEVLRHPDVQSPSVQLRISDDGTLEVISTHDQILGGPQNQVYLGCRFPARPEYRLAIQEAAVKVGTVLAAEGVIGSFGMDFVVADGSVYLSEINLRLGGTTHPFWMARLATGSTYEQATGDLLLGADGSRRFYVATDTMKSYRLAGRAPAEVIAAVDRSGLGYDPATATGTALHLLGAVPSAGKLGATCIADSPEGAEELYRDLLKLLGVD